MALFVCKHLDHVWLCLFVNTWIMCGFVYFQTVGRFHLCRYLLLKLHFLSLNYTEGRQVIVIDYHGCVSVCDAKAGRVRQREREGGRKREDESGDGGWKTNIWRVRNNTVKY